MPLTPGSRLGVYEIIAPIGAGGMGEVYRARDTKLNRDVALKVLPAAFARDADRMARFQREAQALAALNHPNIAQIYGLEGDALVMEYVPGDDLKGPIPLDTALPLARQMAEALEYAHERGIIHRDLKPANIKVTPEGQIKLLDFGLAKALATEGSNPQLGDSDATIRGAILGTAGYMSPEQARGETVDRRTDIWAYGAVLFEMLSGKRLIDEPTASDALAAVLKSNIVLTPLPPETPPHVRRLIERCLVRDQKRRLQAIGEARILLDPAAPTELLHDNPPADKRATAAWIAAAVATVAFGAMSYVAWRASRPGLPAPLISFNVELGADTVLARINNGRMALSPDGTRLAVEYQGADGRIRLGTRFLQQSAILPLNNTEGGHTPFFSPDGKWLGFLTQGKLKKVSLQDGAVENIADVTNIRGVAWGDDGNIVFSPGSGANLARVSANGGPVSGFTKLNPGEKTHRWPQVLPGSKAVLFTAHTATGVYNDATVEVFSPGSDERKVLVRGGFHGQYLPSGHLVYLRDSTLFAAPFDLKRLAVTGPAVQILEDVSSNSTSGGDFSFSQNGIFVYLSGKPAGLASLGWIDSAGKRQALFSPPRLSFTPRFSPDGKRLAFSMNGGQQDDIWVKDLDRGSPTRLTFRSGSNRCPVWTPDGQYVVFRSNDPKTPGLYRVRADGSGEPQRLTDGQKEETPYSFSPDGKFLAYHRATGTGHPAALIAPIEGDEAHPKLGKPEPLSTLPVGNTSPAFSPDGRWIAFSSDESGTPEIYVRRYPGQGRKWQVSMGGGRFPIWSRTKPELFFSKNDEGLMAASYTAKGDAFNSSTPRVWLTIRFRDDSAFPSFDLGADGKRIVTFLPGDDSEVPRPLNHVTFLLNFFDELRRKTAGKP